MYKFISDFFQIIMAVKLYFYFSRPISFRRNVAERVSKSRTAVTNSIRLLKLCDEVQQMIIDDMKSKLFNRLCQFQQRIFIKIFSWLFSIRFYHCDFYQLITFIYGLPINMYDPKSAGSEAYLTLAEEIIRK